MIFLSDNVLLDQPLSHNHIKPRLLGHWGTCPGLVLVYAHLNRIIRNSDLDALMVVGPGMFSSSSLSSSHLFTRSRSPCYSLLSLARGLPQHFLPSIYARPYWPPQTHHQLQRSRWFSQVPLFVFLFFHFIITSLSHINAQTPGAIHEGGELGYALSTSFGAVMDNPDLVVCCVVGDGEAETGPTAAAWHGTKYIDPAESGAVLPILHVNGFKISERTIFGVMDNKEIIALFMYVPFPLHAIYPY